MKRMVAVVACLLPTLAAIGWSGPAASVEVSSEAPPFAGTAYISPDVLTPSDPTDLVGAEYVGQELRTTFDRRVDGWVTQQTHVVRASYGCGLTAVDVIVNPEFTQAQALEEARFYAEVLGRLPPGVRYGVREVWIHAGNEAAGGGNRSILIHTGEGAALGSYIEEVLLHEAAHTTLDYQDWGAGVVQRNPWQRAMDTDGRAISTYARDFPQREDVAESYGAYAVWKVASTIPGLEGPAATIQSTIPHRLTLLDGLGEEFVPRTTACPSLNPAPLIRVRVAGRGKAVTLSWTRPDTYFGIVHYEWRAAQTASALGTWRQAGDFMTTNLRLPSGPRGKAMVVEVRAVWASGPGPVSRVTHRG